MKTIIYHYRGPIERGNGKPGYDWRSGYSANSETGAPLFPWMTYAECKEDARQQGARARFSRPAAFALSSPRGTVTGSGNA